jgi:hypothetical protein
MGFEKMVNNPTVRRCYAAWFRQSLKLLIMLFILLNSCCGQSNIRETPALNPVNGPSLVASPERCAEIAAYIPDQFGKPIGDLIKTYTKDETLSFMGYEVVKSRREAKIGPPKGVTEIEYAVLRRNGRVVAKFDSPIDQLSEVRFGLFSFLGKDAKQLVIEQTSNKFWRYWIVSFQPEFRIIYDSSKYDVVYELRVSDIDRDGNVEIIQNLGNFWYLNSDNVFSPRPPIIFKYNLSTGSYIPANPEFKETVLKDIEQRVGKTREVIESKDDPAYALHVRSAVLDVVLRYLYAGEKGEAWAFYDQHYDVDDKETLRAELKDKLKQDTLYREISNQSQAKR